MMNYLERVKQAMDFYKQNNIGPGWRQDSMVSINYPLMWAEDAARRQGQEGLDFERGNSDFFGGQQAGQQPGGSFQQPAYQRPQPFAYDATRDTPPPMAMQNNPTRGLINNYFSRLLGSR